MKNPPKIVRAADAEVLQSPTDIIRLLVAGEGDVQVAEITSTDRVGPPVHTQEWDEIQYVVSGEAEFWLDGEWHLLNAGDVQVLPAGTPHTVRIPEGEAKLLQVTWGAPFDAFIREMVALDNDPTSAGPAKGEAATRHGVRSVVPSDAAVVQRLDEVGRPERPRPNARSERSPRGGPSPPSGQAGRNTGSLKSDSRSR